MFLSWQSAADNVTKAAELLHLFVDENIDDNQPFSVVRQQALKVMNDRDIQTLCLYLKNRNGPWKSTSGNITMNNAISWSNC